MLLKRLSEASGVHILSNTGYYGAAKDKHLPAHAFDESAEQLAARWMRECERGIDGTGIKPAFMKIGVDESPLSRRSTPSWCAPPRSRTARPAWRLPRTRRPAPPRSKSSICSRPPRCRRPRSSGSTPTPSATRRFHARAARRGAWVEFDGISAATVARHVALVGHMKAEGLLGHVLVSHDAGWYRVGEPGGGQFRPYDTLFTAFVPALKASGFGDAEIRQLLVDNPRRALARRTSL